MTDQNTASQRVARAQAALVARGGRKLSMMLQPDAARALQELMDAGYGKNNTRTAAAVIDRALLDAQSTFQPRPAALTTCWSERRESATVSASSAPRQ